nr:RNA-directed DNA polymerase, eukaryota, reverse transcriptase zinc-binding domain protein [Tanacetum cinerariifolium]
YHDRKVIQDSLIEIDLRLDKGNGLPDDLTKRVNLFRDLKDIDHKDSIDLAQKAKIIWAVEGDENSKFFHGIVNKKRRHLAIKGILVDGEWIENPNRVKSEFYSYYSNLFSAPAWDRSLFDVNFPRRLNSDQVVDLEDMVSNEEIKRAVWDCGSDKSPGPDGFTFDFLRNFGLLVPISHLFYADDAMFIVKKVSNKLSNWKAKTLSVGGRLTLLKSVLGAIPTYYMSLFKAPEGIISLLEKMLNKFFLGADKDDRKITWVYWNKVLAHKNKGGLGVNSLYALNLASIFKWIWRFLASSSSLWIKVIKSIHGNSGALDNPYSSRLKNSTWIGILKAINKLKVKGVDLMGYYKIVIGNGSTTRFWHDIWYGDICFKEKFKQLFNLELQKDANVASKLQASNVASSFRRPPRSDGGTDPSSWDSWLNGMNLSSMQRRILEATFISMWWHIWKFKNLTLFSSKKPRKDRIFDDIVSHTYFWLSNRCRSFIVSMNVWLNDLLNAL